MLRLSESPSNRIKNLATVFLQDYCSEGDVRRVREMQEQEDKRAKETGAGDAALLPRDHGPEVT